MNIEIDEHTLYEIKKLLIKLNFLSKCAIDSSVEPIEIEKIFESLSDEAKYILKQLKD